MRKGSKLSLIGLIVVTYVTVLLFLIIFPVLYKVRMSSFRSMCISNLKGLGNAMQVYAEDFDGMYPQLPGKGPWSKRLGFDYYMETPDFETGGAEEYNSRTITASWYLLVREADIAPKSFICPFSDQSEFDGTNATGLDIVELWDFGADPYKHVSYAYQNPYGNFSARKNLSNAFAIAADMSPWFKNGDIVNAGSNENAPQITDFSNTQSHYLGNSTNHSQFGWLWPYRRIPNTAYGHFVLFGDSHSSFEKSSTVGVKYDNIYTFWSTTDDPNEQDIRGGTAPTARDKDNDAKSKDDSFLAI